MSARATLTIAANDIRRRVRDRTVILVGLIAPLLLAAILSVSFGQFPTTVHVVVGIVGAETPAGRTFVDALESPGAAGIAGVRSLPNEATARAATARHEIDAAVLFPAATTAAPVTVLVDESNPAHDATARIVVDHALDRSPERITDLQVVGEGARSSAASFFGPSMAILFLFLLSAANARAILEERQLGTLHRLAVAPIRSGIVLVGKLAAAATLSLASMLSLWIATSWLLHASWGPAAGVVLVSSATVLAATALMGAVAVFVDSEEQSQSLAAVVAFTLAIIGGNFLPVSELPSVLRHLAPWTPNAWAMRAFDDLSFGSVSASTLRAVGVLLVFAIGGLAVALSRARGRFAS